jgi:hypothetical protein
VASKTEKGVLVKALKKADAILKEMVSMTLRSNLTRIQRISLETCITVHMHQKESTGASSFPNSWCEESSAKSHMDWVTQLHYFGAAGGLQPFYIHMWYGMAQVSVQPVSGVSGTGICAVDLL